MNKSNSQNHAHHADLLTSITITLLVVLFFGGTGSLMAQSVTVGSGSYSTSLPSGAVGPQTFSGANATPKISASFDQPVQTNDFWSSLIYPFFGDAHSNKLYAHPLNFKATSFGLEMGYTTEHIYAANDFLYPYVPDLTVGVTGLSASQTTTLAYGDWTVTASWDDGPVSMEATLGHGLPYAFFRINGGNATITSASTPTIWQNQNEILALTIAGKHYGIFAPTGSSWSGRGDRSVWRSLRCSGYDCLDQGHAAEAARSRA